MITISNWEDFQHYKHRRPPWLKLYRSLLEQQAWHELSDHSGRLLIELWMLACEGKVPGIVDLDSNALAWRLRRASKVATIENSLQELADKRFISIASTTLAGRLQPAIPEESREEESRVVLYPFEDFWDVYDYKKKRGKCEPKWDAMSDTDKAACMAAAPAYVKSTPDKQFRMHPETYLNGRCWEDEVVVPDSADIFAHLPKPTPSAAEYGKNLDDKLEKEGKLDVNI